MINATKKKKGCNEPDSESRKSKHMSGRRGRDLGCTEVDPVCMEECCFGDPSKAGAKTEDMATPGWWNPGGVQTEGPAQEGWGVGGGGGGGELRSTPLDAQTLRGTARGHWNWRKCRYWQWLSLDWTRGDNCRHQTYRPPCSDPGIEIPLDHLAATLVSLQLPDLVTEKVRVSCSWGALPIQSKPPPSLPLENHSWPCRLVN